MATAAELDAITREVIGAALEVHSKLGPGLYESTYEECLVAELARRGIAFERQKPVPLFWKGVELGSGYRLDLLVAGAVVVEIKAVDGFAPIHLSQMLTYLRLVGCRVGLLLNFNVVRLKDGIRRVVDDFPSP